MQTIIRYRDDKGNLIMSMREEKLKTLSDVIKDIEYALIIVNVAFIAVVTAVAIFL
ncbi:hypothetical protein [Paenibacillus tianjinensis]|uniref:Uncharacterized protein n=1 Tax=Paenibacillus tianjinensis TaxID=2810347 RepID=A0ABX7L7Z2_9BACL|nr:hypothetical protein [Paenibacillus tianjinensis]QSF43488.1 hypothetical protein JRJ22_19685 [Paenibacillus tianjinensis]